MVVFQRGYRVSLCALIQLCRSRAQSFRLACIFGLDTVGFEGDESVGILCKTSGHRFRQRGMAGLFTQHRFGQFQVERAGIADQIEIVFHRLALARQTVGQAADHHLPGRTAGQAEYHEQRQQAGGAR